MVRRAKVCGNGTLALSYNCESDGAWPLPGCALPPWLPVLPPWLSDANCSASLKKSICKTLPEVQTPTPIFASHNPMFRRCMNSSAEPELLTLSGGRSRKLVHKWRRARQVRAMEVETDGALVRASGAYIAAPGPGRRRCRSAGKGAATEGEGEGERKE
jgi:hypothetical protein